MVMNTVNVLICLITLTSQHVYSKVITVNSDGNNTTECCINGNCSCSSLYTALLHLDSNTVINITSQSVTLDRSTTLGSGNLSNITITGSNVTILCNNGGSVYCESCDHVVIEGITWDRCGDSNDGTNTAGVSFNITSNISLIDSMFQYSPVQAVSLLQVSGNVLIELCSFISNGYGGLAITRQSSNVSNNLDITITISESCFYMNGYSQDPLADPLDIDIEDLSIVDCNVTLNHTKFISNVGAMELGILVSNIIDINLIGTYMYNNSVMPTFYGSGIAMYLTSISSDVFLTIISSNFSSNYASDVWGVIQGNDISVTVNDTSFTDSKPAANATVVTVGISSEAVNVSVIEFHNVQFTDNLIAAATDMVFDAIAALSIILNSDSGKVVMDRVNFTSNQYLGADGGALYIVCTGGDIDDGDCYILINECEFWNNTSPGHGAALFVTAELIKDVTIQIVNTSFNHNVAGSSIVHVTQETTQSIQLMVNASQFTNNVGSSMYLPACDVLLSGMVLFMDNTAENGGALYLNQGSTVTITDGATVNFINNMATLNGGAIYIDLVFSCDSNTFQSENSGSPSYQALFINNSARIAGNSMYFNIPRSCSVITNISDTQSMLYVPCQYNYSELVNDTMMLIPCDLDYTALNGSKPPIATSPHELRLYFPFHKGFNISSTSEHNHYYIENNILGYPVMFTGAVFDYFGKPTDPIQFSVQIQCDNDKCHVHSLIGDEHILIQTVDNFTALAVNLKGTKVVTGSVNVTIALTSLFYSLKKITTTLTVEVVPCVTHPGFAYHNELQTCVCYHHNVKCNGSHSEIKRGYWFGSIKHHHDATTSLCPNHYCMFIGSIETTQGYFALPDKTDAQCHHRREGTACGECSAGYTLSYDSTNCISVDKCSAWWTILVIVLTCLYWIAVVVGVFSLMYFNFQISSGYLYGIIYYYSMIGILLDNNPYVSDGAFQFVSVLSSFAQLSPQFLGQLCFVKGMSGIDQLFIHYSHAVAVSLLLLLIVLAARCSPRISLFVSRCIIRVICLLILLSYTSIASTSLQLLQPLRFTDVNEVYTYSSPHIQYFHHQHAIYGSVAAISEVFIAIGIPLLLLLEPVLSRKMNFVKIKPLLDQFQGCFKDKYRWFAAYYLICRQVIFLIVYTLNTNYYNMLFYLQTACLVIVMIHMWIQPYQNDLLNALDGVMLLVMLLVVNINTFPFLHDVTTGISLILVIFPLFLFCMIAVKEVVQNYGKKSSRAYNRIIDTGSNSDDMNSGQHHLALRNVEAINESEAVEGQNYNTFQESLLEFTSNNN